MKVLWYIQSGRKFKSFWAWANRVDFVDKLIVKYHMTHRAHRKATDFFFKHGYDYLIFGHDDYLGSPDHIRLLIEDERKYKFPVVSGWSNIWLPPTPEIMRSCVASVSSKPNHIKKRSIGYNFFTMRDMVMADKRFPFRKAWFVGTPLTLIRREVLKKVPIFNYFKTVKDAFCVTPETKKHGRGIMFDVRFAIDCEKHGIPIIVDQRVFLLHFGKQGMYDHLRVGKDRPTVLFVKKKRS